EKIGLVNKVVPVAELQAEAVKLARKLAGKPAVAMSMAKAAINLGGNMDINSGLDLEIQSFVVSFASEDRAEGMKAFAEKRKPNFTDK
ncbi:MAG TPA: enoyl-CoA hydratase-related protein, partial [Bacillota bacterium]|nr:enoyl-CoA hydratase-related protein [Bacillota bacterium]